MCLTVSDTGHGMEKGALERIFDPFFTTKGPREGTGLGLSVVEGIVKGLGGEITVHSEPGLGTSFNVFLPTAEEQLLPESKVAEALPTGNERILFIDDEKALADMGGKMLESLGYLVTAKTDSIEALETFRSKPEEYDLVITDMTMPGLTGRELAKELMAIRPDVPIILCTGFSSQINETLAVEAGLRELVMKPYNIATMAQVIRRCWRSDDLVSRMTHSLLRRSAACSGSGNRKYSGPVGQASFKSKNKPVVVLDTDLPGQCSII